MITLLFALILGTALGFLLLILLLKDSTKIYPGLLLFLAGGLGLGCAAMLCSYSFILYNGMNRILVLSISALFFLVLFCLTAYKKCLSSSLPAKIPWGGVAITLLGLILAFFLIKPIAYLHPFGEWDGWAVWNTKTKFLINGAEHWDNLYQLHKTARPDYPLLLPFIHVWLYTLSAQNLEKITLFTGMVFTLGNVGLVFCGLRRYISLKLALIPLGILLFFYPFIFFGTTQYADIILAYYLLASSITLIISVRENQPNWAFLCGLFMGLTCYSKNEGLIIILILLLSSTVYLLLSETGPKFPKLEKLKLLLPLLTGFILTLPPTLIFKYLFAPTTPDIGQNLFTAQLAYFNLKGFNIILGKCIQLMADPEHWQLFLLMAIMFLMAPFKYFYKESRILSWFFISYGFVILFIYLTTVDYDLNWRLMRTLPRIFLYQLPTLIFLHFYAHWAGDKHRLNTA